MFAYLAGLEAKSTGSWRLYCRRTPLEDVCLHYSEAWKLSTPAIRGAAAAANTCLALFLILTYTT